MFDIICCSLHEGSFKNECKFERLNSYDILSLLKVNCRNSMNLVRYLKYKGNVLTSLFQLGIRI